MKRKKTRRAIEREIEVLQKRIDNYEEKLEKAQQEMLQLREELQQKDAQMLFEAFLASNRTMDQVMVFLGSKNLK